MLAQGKDVYVFSDNPNIGLYHYRHLYFVERGFSFAPPQPEINSELTEEANAKIKAIVAKYPQAHWVEIDFKRYIPNDYKHMGLALYSDDDHFNRYGAAYLAQRFIEDGQQLIVPKAE